ncbi:MAG: hypothetical protein R6X31_06260 [Anaerolineae bacterium]
MKTEGLTGAIRYALSDGEWHTIASLVHGEVGRHISPEQASRAWRNKYGKTTLEGTGGSSSYSISEGRRIVMMQAIARMLRLGELEVKHGEERRQIVAVRATQ